MDPPPSRSTAEINTDVHAQNFKLPLVDNVRPSSPPPPPPPPPNPPPLRASVIFRYSQPGTLRARASLGI